jgi:hypothetical protein
MFTEALPIDSLSKSVTIGSVTLGRQKYIQLNHQYMVLGLLRLKLLLQSQKGINCQVVIKFQQN